MSSPQHQTRHDRAMPSWLTPKTGNHLKKLVHTALAAAGIDTNKTYTQYSREHFGRNRRRKMLRNSLKEAPGHTKATPTTVVLAVAGKTPHEDFAFITVSGSHEMAARLRDYLHQQPNDRAQATAS